MAGDRIVSPIRSSPEPCLSPPRPVPSSSAVPPRADSGFQERPVAAAAEAALVIWSDNAVAQTGAPATVPLGRCCGMAVEKGCSVVWHAPTAPESAKWARRTAERLGACVGLRRRASRPHPLVGRRCALCGGARAGWRWHGSTRASPEPPLQRALGRACAVRAAATSVPTICCARNGMRSMTRVLVVVTCTVDVPCDML